MTDHERQPVPTCNGAISFAPGRGATFTCHKPGDHDQYQQNRWHHSIHDNLRIEWTDDHRKAFRKETA